MMQNSSFARMTGARPPAFFLCAFAALVMSTAAGAASLAPPTISGSPLTTITAGRYYTFTPKATGPTGYRLTFSISGKPAWAGFSRRSGHLFGTPTTANIGKYSNIVISVTDGAGRASLAPFAITVTGSGTASNTPPTISGTPPTSATVGNAYTFTPKASDTDGDSISFSVQNKPAWMSFSITTGTISGTPTASDVGSYSGIAISASDGHTSVALPAFSIAVANASSTATTLAQKYPGDVGMASDPSVVWSENFEEGSVPAVLARYSSDTNPAGMALTADHPANSSGQHSIELTSGGSNPATDFYKSFGTGYDELYFRYYAKYVGSGPWHHSGLWFGGYNPPLSYPAPHAGTKPVGNDRFSIGLEPIQDFTGVPMDFYAYWMGMHSWKTDPTGAVGDYWGNTLLHDAEFRTQSNTWVCYEVHLKLNPDPTNGSGAVLEVWENDNLIRRFDDTGPYGYWVKDKFCPNDADGSECTAYRPANPVLALLDQQWRSTTALKINYFWPQNYNDASTTSSLLLDDMVVAKQRIGCTVKK